jgi:hypothetical protein
VAPAGSAGPLVLAALEAVYPPGSELRCRAGEGGRLELTVRCDSMTAQGGFLKMGWGFEI